MYPQSELGKLRLERARKSVPEVATLLRAAGCKRMTARRLYGIEHGVLRLDEQERQALATLYGLRPWELPI